ncbi:MAG: phage tail sheath C-terminal domain-containing protein [Moraxellaceae bacterium]|nr:phage tail sheath C-terminal domain-containing protein [Moraxellaceae bacterium]
MSLVFETALPPDTSVLARADVACFVGFVARRRQVPLPPSVQAQLDADGWVKGPWRRGEDGLHALDNLPVVVDSWELFDSLFAWERRPLGRKPDPVSGAIAHCASYMGAAVRSFFAHGGKRAIIVRVGDPWPFLETGSNRAAKRRARLQRLIPDFTDGDAAEPFDPLNPRSWGGIHHLYGLRQVSMLCLPDLPDACATEPLAPPTTLEIDPPPEGFVECSGADREPPKDSGLRDVYAPRLDSRGYGPWRIAVAAVRAFLARHQREVMFVGALPLPREDAYRPTSRGHVHAHTDMLAFLRRAGVFESSGHYEASALSAASAFVQLGYPWLRTRASVDLPENLEPADGTLAGLIAANALARGSFRSVAGDFSQQRLRDVAGAEPVPAWGIGPDSPDAQLARRICLFAPQPGGWALQSDVTTSPAEAWRFGGASRLMASILRTARARGEAMVFEANGPQLWAQVRRGIEELLTRYWQRGALLGRSPEEAFSVRCGRDTMNQNDLDNGRIVVEISVRPAPSVERITVVLALASAGTGDSSLREVA